MSRYFKRLPTFLANLPLRLMPFTEQQQAAYDKTGFVRDIAFKTTPRVGKVCLCVWLPSTRQEACSSFQAAQGVQC